MLKPALTVAATAAAVLLPATAASAWSVGYEEGIQDQIQMAAANGEHNVMTLARVGTSLRMVDHGGVSKAFAPCQKSGATGADCPFDAPDKAVWMSLGDENDIAMVQDGFGVTIGMDGGAGDDRLGNGEAPGMLSAGDGGDVIRPGLGADTVLGGDGFDVVTYLERTQPVHVDLGGGAVSGEDGEGDTVTGVEAVLTGAGDDLIVGTDAEEELRSAAGKDRITARGGADAIDVRDGYPDTVDCGAGADTVVADQLDVLTGCETVSVEQVAPAEPPVAGPSAAIPGPPAAPAPAPAGSALPPVLAAADRTRPALRALKVTRRGATATVRFSLSERASVAVTVERCTTAKRCRKVKTIRRTARSGPNALRVRTGTGRRLRVKVVATDAAGNRSRAAVKRLPSTGR